MKLIKSFILVVLAIAFTTNLTYAQSAETAAAEETTVAKTKSMTVKVKGVGCHNDLKRISQNVEELEGVSSCETKKLGAVSSFNVVFDPALVTEKEIHRAIEDTEGCENPKDRPYKVKV